MFGVKSESNRWFVGRTLARKEGLARYHLEQQGFEVFLPSIMSTRRHARKTEVLKVALFPCYLFIKLDLLRTRWRAINGTVGMVGILMAGDSPCPVPVGFVEHLQQSSRSDNVIEDVQKLAPGDAVEVISGHFAGQAGQLLRLDGNKRVELLLDIVNGAVRVKVARDLLRVTR